MRVQLAKAWLQMGLEVDFVLLRRAGELLSHVPTGASVFELAAPKFRNAVGPLVRYLQSRKPTVLLGAVWPLTVVAVAAAKLACVGSRVIVSEHSVLSMAYANRGLSHRTLLRASLAAACRGADARIGVSSGTVADVAALAWMSRADFDVIHNPAALGATKAFVRPGELAQIHGPVILAVGTLKAVKNHALLIDAFARLDPALGATLCILGEGSLRDALEGQIERAGLAGRVLLPGFRADTRPFYAHADVFVLSSNHEGFGNVLVEALDFGLPIVSTNCPAGPREILADGKYGRLVPVGDAEAMSRAISAALIEPVDREFLRARAAVFSLDFVARRYVEIMLPKQPVLEPLEERSRA